ncbi:MAG: DegV family protein [Oscillospiraceae bacterium]|nr:DegV family protein [Oscillospiraceae bacterium]
MAKPVIISADSTCDLPQELVERYDIRIIPLTVLLGEDSYFDDSDFNPDKIYEYYKESGKLPKTSAPSVQQFIDFFTPMVEAGYEVVHLDISSELSATFSSGRIAASELEGIYNIDSRSLCTGISLLILEAAKCRDDGMSAAEIAAHIEALVPKVETSFVIDTLEFLWKGGRCSGVAALGANMLKLRPAISMKDGKLDVYKKYRGNMQNVYKQYVRETLSAKEVYGENIFLVDSGEVAPETVSAVKEIVEELAPGCNVICSRAGSTISSHCGPGAMGVIFIRK